jgi:hypothetical protein
MVDKELSIEYSLDTPVFANSNILTKKLFEIVKNNNITGGGISFGLDTSNYIGILIGIIIIIIGFVLLWFVNDLVETEATIVTKSCDNNQNDGFSCKLNITYIVDTIQYSKIITIKGSNIYNQSTIKIYYSQSEPNSIQLVNPNYSMIGIGSIILGFFIIIYSMYNNSDTDIISGNNFPDTKTNIYSNSSIVDGLNVVYS